LLAHDVPAQIGVQGRAQVTRSAFKG